MLLTLFSIDSTCKEIKDFHLIVSLDSSFVLYAKTSSFLSKMTCIVVCLKGTVGALPYLCLVQSIVPESLK